jgi:hypothetical protein
LTGIMNDAHAAARMAQLKSEFADTWFAWSGPTTLEPDRNGTAYYRMQGPKLFIELSPYGVGGDLSNHVHTSSRGVRNEAITATQLRLPRHTSTYR